MRLIDAEKLVDDIRNHLWDWKTVDGIKATTVLRQTLTDIGNQPTVGDWISVKDRLPEEHESIFGKLYGTEKWQSTMWRTESDRVLVAIRFPDGTRTVDKGKLQEGTWRTGVSHVIPQEVTHWALWPEPPEEVSGDADGT